MIICKIAEGTHYKIILGMHTLCNHIMDIFHIYKLFRLYRMLTKMGIMKLETSN